MGFYNEVFGNNELFKDIDSLQLLEPFMYTTPLKIVNETPKYIPSPPDLSSDHGSEMEKNSDIPERNGGISSISVNNLPCSTEISHFVDQDGQASIRAPHVVLKPGSLGLLCPGQVMIAEDTEPDPVSLPTSTVRPLPVKCSNTNVLVKQKNNMMPGIFPKKPDNLFWCIYVALYGYNEYIQIGHRYGNIEIEEKHKMMVLMTKNPTFAKNSTKKITKALFQEIMSDFMTNKKITMDMLTMIANYHNKRFWITFLTEMGEPEPYFMEISSNDACTTEIILLYKRGKNDVSISDENTNSSVYDNIRNTRFKFENGDSPLKAISTYKTHELEHIFDVLDIEREPDKKYKKIDYYQCIMAKCSSV
jgi:hypothetical protein